MKRSLSGIRIFLEDNEEDVVDFEGLAEKLISAAEVDDEDNNESETTTPVPQNSSSTNSISGPLLPHIPRRSQCPLRLKLKAVLRLLWVK
jgi:hypothetical protein